MFAELCNNIAIYTLSAIVLFLLFLPLLVPLGQLVAAIVGLLSGLLELFRARG